MKQPSDELNAELQHLEKEQQLRGQVEAAGSAINELSARMQGLALIVHKAGLELNMLESSPKYAAGNLGGLPEFRTQGNTYSLMSQPISLANYKEAPALTEIIGSESPSPERQAFNDLERERMLAYSELAKSEKRLATALMSQDKTRWQPLADDVTEKKLKLKQVNQQIAQLKN